jgi:oleandomycin transport system ATP-binding protein
MTYAIQADGLVKKYGDTVALAGVDLAVRQGTVLGVLGPNGAGKTTAVRVMATLLRPDGGTVRVGGYDVVKNPTAVRAMIGLAGQYAAVDEDLTGYENLLMIARLLEMPRPRARAVARELLDRFGLGDAAGRSAKTYSGGMRRRLDLAASMVGEPRILFLDEPTTGLDPRSRTDVWEMIRAMVDDGVTVLLTTQYLDEADQLANEIVVIDHGRVIAHGSADALKARLGKQIIAVRPVELARLGTVAQLLERVTGATPTRSPEGGMVSVPASDERQLDEVIGELRRSGISVSELYLRLPSLDEVFLTLTGHPAEADDDGTDTAPTTDTRSAA